MFFFHGQILLSQSTYEVRTLEVTNLERIEVTWPNIPKALIWACVNSVQTCLHPGWKQIPNDFAFFCNSLASLFTLKVWLKTHFYRKIKWLDFGTSSKMMSQLTKRDARRIYCVGINVIITVVSCVIIMCPLVLKPNQWSSSFLEVTEMAVVLLPEMVIGWFSKIAVMQLSEMVVVRLSEMVVVRLKIAVRLLV